MNEIEFLAEWALRSSILIFGGALLIWLTRIKDPAIRLAGWIALLLGSLLIPVMTMTLPVVPVPVLRAAAPIPPEPAEVVQVDFTASVPPVPETVSQAPPKFYWYRAGLALYAIVASALLLRLCLGLYLSWRILRRSRRTGRNFFASPDIASPATLGILRPLVVLPRDWPEWEPAKLASVLAHERSHIERYDPAVQFLSAIHRALLWFSPAAWFLHSKVVRTGEEVSDDAAIAVTGDRPAYAGMLVDFMQRRALPRHYLSVPMSRYGRADRRIQRILDCPTLSRGVARLGFAAILLVASPLAYFTATAAPPPVFEVASIKPALRPAGPIPRYCPIRCDGRLSVSGSRVDIRNISLYGLIVMAYQVQRYQVSGPKWMDSALFDIAARLPAGVSANEVPEMLRSMLATRFRLSIRRDVRDLPVYGLVIGRGGSRLKKSTVNDIALPDAPGAENLYTTQGEARWDPHSGITARGGPLGNQRTLIAKDGTRQVELSGVTMEGMARWLTERMDRPVIDMTNLAGKYRLAYYIPSSADPQYSMTATILNVLEEAGLKLDHRSAQIEIMMVDHLEKAPTGN